MRKFDSNLLSGESLLDLGGLSATRYSSSVQFADLAATTALSRPDSDWLRNFIQLTDVSVGGTGGTIDSFSTEFIPSDPGFGNQWFLRNTTAGQFDINVEDVWDDYTGDGVLVTIIDSGFRFTHDDLDANYLTAQDYDYDQNDFTPSISSHGTAVAGIIAAEEGNSLGGVGVAWDSDIRGYEGLAFAVFADQILDAAGLGDGINNTNGDMFGGDILSMSFGTSQNVFIDTADVRAGITAFGNASANGRGGLGQIHVKSSGNSRDVANSAFREEGVGELADSSKYTISVAALRQDGWVTDFSTPGANVHISAFADNTSNNSAIYTTTSSSDTAFTSSFGGTSAAAPEVSGVIALMLEANSQLGWRDVHEILALTARHTGSDVGAGANVGAPAGGGHEQATKGATGTWQFNGADSELQWNGGGLHHSNDYGFGMIDALAAVRLAETWNLQQTSANDFFLFVNNMTAVGDTTPTFGAGNDWTHTIASGSNFLVEHVTLELSAVIDQLDEIEIVITSPSGTSIQLLADTGDTQSITLSNWDFGTPGFWGEEAAGTWTVNIVDEDGAGTTITDIDLEFQGKTLSGNDLFVFTNEYSDYDGLFGHVTDFQGFGTSDTINASAVSSNTIFDGVANTGTIDGVAITHGAIEIVYTGDGNDTIIGDAFTTELYGGRGNDSITGGSSTEILDGGAGTDTIIGANNGDTANGGDGNDTFRYDGPTTITGATTLNGDAGSDKILVNGAGTYDFQAAGFNIDDMEELEFFFNAGEDKTVIFNAKELDQPFEVPANFRIDGNASGIDTLIINVLGGGLGSIDMSAWIFQDWTQGTDTITVNGDANANTFDGSVVADILNGGGGADTLNGNEGDDILNGGAGDDTLNGGLGDDYLIGGGGTDTFDGGDGEDTIDYSGNAADGTLSLTGSPNSGTGTFGAITETWTNVESFIMGSGDDTFNWLHFIAAPVHTLDGNTGTDLFSIAGSGSAWNIDLTAGTAMVGATLHANLLNIENVDGNGSANTIIGSGLANVINGGGGNDTINGNGGADTINGGDGDDLVIWDIYDGAASFDGGAGTDTLQTAGYTWVSTVEIDLGAGEIRFNGAFLHTLANFENYDASANGSTSDETVIGTSGVNIISTADGNNTIDAGGGADTVNAGGGNDVVQDNDFVNFDVYDGGAGIDTIDYSGVTFAAGLVTIDLSMNQTIVSGGGNTETLLNFENVEGSDGSETIIGNGQTNVLNGNGGDDIIIARNGDDTVHGGAGNDTIYGQGDDDILSGGTGDDSLVGGLGNDELYGSADNDLLNGQAGDDTLSGDNGDDNLLGASGNDTLYGGDGTDSITAGGGDDLAFGGLGNDTINGGIGFDNISGGGGDDTLLGGNQNDILNGNAGFDNLNGNAGNDTLNGGANDDTLIGESGADMLFGDGGNDNLSGGSGGDDLFGDAGNDVLDGGGGNDDMNGGAGADIFVANLGFRTDRIQDFEDGIDLIDFSGNVLANNIGDVLAAATQVGLNVRIELNANNILILEGFDLADLDASDFIF